MMGTGDLFASLILGSNISLCHTRTQLQIRLIHFSHVPAIAFLGFHFLRCGNQCSNPEQVVNRTVIHVRHSTQLNRSKFILDPIHHFWKTARCQERGERERGERREGEEERKRVGEEEERRRREEEERRRDEKKKRKEKRREEKSRAEQSRAEERRGEERREEQRREEKRREGKG
eukprot:s816_g2.t1